MIVRLSQKLAKKIKAGPLKSLPLDDNPLADWSCHLFTANRAQYILVSNTKSLFSCVLLGRGITNDSLFIERVLNNLREFMEDNRLALEYDKFIAPSTGSVSFAKALNRRVTGSINELVMEATHALESGELAPHDVGFSLNEFPLSAIALKEDRGYGRPNEAFERLLAEQL